MSSHKVLRNVFGLALVVLLLCGCNSTIDVPITASEYRASTTSEPTPTATETPAPMVTLTATATQTPRASPTATMAPTATLTPTALPVLISGSPRTAALKSAAPQSSAPCGVVDLLDYPLSPPNAEDMLGGHDFGEYRSHYGGYHTGEDWWGPGGRSLGLRVYSIGHGTVTYAAPRGWGVDGGTVVVQHVLSDGSTILSFYGHLDPSSVVLHAGDCVARGEPVGRIGRPSSPPHLHFEIRTHLPDGPGPGYWPSDPSLAGWEPPSQTIWDHRIANSPGVLWTRPSAAWRGTRGLGMLDDDTFLVVENDRLLGVRVSDGSLDWSEKSSIRATRGAIDMDRSMLYTVNHYTGRVEAFRMQDPRRGEEPTDATSPLVPAWEIRLDANGCVTLMPLPSGGFAASCRQKLFGVSESGKLLWAHDAPAQVLDWVLVGDLLVFSTTGEHASLWTVDEGGRVARAMPTGGHLVALEDRILVYGEDGAYWLGTDMLPASFLCALPKGRPEQGDLSALADGGYLVIHADSFDKRLILLNGDGTLRWQRSVARPLRGNDHHLLVVDGRPLIVSHRRSAATSELSVFGIDLNRGVLVRLFAVRGWTPRPGEIWAHAIGEDLILLNIGSGVGSGRLVALNTRLALESITQAVTAE